MYQNLSFGDVIPAIKMFYFKNHDFLLRKKLIKYLGNVNLSFFDSGRAALRYVLKNRINKNKKYILVPSFTCEVVPIEVIKSNLKPIYYDSSPETIEVFKNIKKSYNDQVGGVIYQHSFGVHKNIKNIIKFCKFNKIILIEDKALCMFSKKKKVKELQGDYAYYSLECSKTVTTRMGGILIYDKKINLNINYKYSLIKKLISDFRTFISIFSYNLKGDLGFIFRKILIISRIILPSITKAELKMDKINSNVFYDLTNFQKCILLYQLYKLPNLKKLNKKNINFWKSCLKDLKLENIKFYSNYFPLRLMYNGSKSQKVKKILVENGLKQEDWFLGGVGSKNFPHKSINFNINKYKDTKVFCSNYTNLPTMIYLSKELKNSIKVNLEK